jgi:uncharacterized protein YbcI
MHRMAGDQECGGLREPPGCEESGSEPVSERAGAGSASSPALAISNAVGRVHKQLVGRGPTQVRTHLGRDVVLCLLEGGFTQAERTVLASSGESVVLELRAHLQKAMRRAIIESVEAIVGRRVRSFMYTNDPARDLQAELMLLESTG